MIKSALAARGVKYTVIADMVGRSKYTVSHIVNCRGRSRRIQEAVALIINKDFEDVWGYLPEEPHRHSIVTEKLVANG